MSFSSCGCRTCASQCLGSYATGSLDLPQLNIKVYGLEFSLHQPQADMLFNLAFSELMVD